ncbi:MAG: hypothetical protein ABIR70_13975 [Bryobacteraceae bacterium]
MDRMILPALLTLLLPPCLAQSKVVATAAARFQPEVTWQEKSVIHADFSCQGRREAAILGTTKETIVVAIFINGSAQKPELVTYPQDVFAPTWPLSIEIDGLDYNVKQRAEDLGTPLQGLQRSKTCKGIYLGNHQEDGIHIYWNRVMREFNEWRL